MGTSRKARPNPAQGTGARTAAKSLADPKRELGSAAAAGNAQAAAIIAEYAQAVTTADSSISSNEDNSTSDNSVVIDPIESESPGVQLAEESLLPDVPPVAEREMVPLDKLDPALCKLTAEQDWKQVLVELLAGLEQSGSRLPIPVLNEKRKIDSLLADKRHGQPQCATFPTPTKRYTKVLKLGPEGNRPWTVVADGEKMPWETFWVESEADNAIEYLNSPVVSLSDIADGCKRLPVSATLDCAANGSMHGGTV